MRRVLLLLTLMVVGLSTFAQPKKVWDVVNWKFTSKQLDDSTFNLIASVVIKDNYHIYTATPGGDGTEVATEVKFNTNSNIRLVGKVVVDGKPIKEDIKELGYSIEYYKNKVTYTQKAIVKKNTNIKGQVTFMACREECFRPETLDFSIKIDGLKENDTASNDTAIAAVDSPAVPATVAANSDSNNSAASVSASDKEIGSTMEKSSLWELFLTGLGAGFIAFIMPCIYAMLPITVSFFTKRSKDRATGVRNATFYSLSIIAIFTAIGLLVSVLFGEKTMYEISTSMGFNLFVFILFIVFGISLLGAFEITLPASWSSKLDSKANANSFGGIFFMALVLVVVSFSCTSAFISWLIVHIVQSGNSLGGVVGFFGFGLAIALPFALGAFFPGLLNNIAKSGGWLNTVKVTMGFLELALAMKFLSNIDLQYHWHLLDFEVYLAIWIVIFGLLGFYLLGKLRFSHDDELPRNMFGHTYLSVPRLFFAIAALAFTTYLIPGLWGAPLAGVSGFLPERKTLDFNIHDNLINIQANGGGAVKAGDDNVRPVKYTENLKSELPGVVAYFDYEEALAASRKTGKPVLLDFTGHSCVNCRKMERAVLSKPDVLRDLNQNFIVASLYCDDKTPLPENERYTSPKDGSQIKTLGDKNLDLELTKYGAVAQPLYIFVDGNGNLLKNAGGFEPDVQRFMNIMKEVKEAHKKGH